MHNIVCLKSMCDIESLSQLLFPDCEHIENGVFKDMLKKSFHFGLGGSVVRILNL